MHRSTGYSNHLHDEPALGRIDVVYVGAIQATKSSPTQGGSPRPGKTEIPVPCPEYIAAMRRIRSKTTPPGRSANSPTSARCSSAECGQGEVNGCMKSTAWRNSLTDSMNIDSRTLDLEKDVTTTGDVRVGPGVGGGKARECLVHVGRLLAPGWTLAAAAARPIFKDCPRSNCKFDRPPAGSAETPRSRRVSNATTL